MTAIIQLPPLHQGYSTARYILRNHSFHDLEAIDAAFEVLAHSQDPADRALCRIVEDEMWLVPSPSPLVAAATVAVMGMACFGVATLLAGFVQ
jgi:hypothetical protein